MRFHQSTVHPGGGTDKHPSVAGTALSRDGDCASGRSRRRVRLHAVLLGCALGLAGDILCSNAATGPAGARGPSTLPLRLGPEPRLADAFKIQERDTPNPGAVFNTSAARTTLKSVEISALELVYDPRDPGSPLAAYAGREDLLRLSIVADRVIVRGALRLPGAQVSIQARELVLEDLSPEAPALIDTTPVAIRDRAPKAADYDRANRRAGADGIHGESGGGLRLLLGSLVATGTAKRFMLNGTSGQDPGKGDDGANGRSVPVWRYEGYKGTKWTNVIYVDRTVLLDAENTLRDIGNFFAKPFNRGKPPIKKVEDIGSPTEPTSGTPALAGGQPGNGGNGGSVYTNLSAELIAPLAEQRPGDPGKRSRRYHGGRAGTPTTWRKLKEDGITTWETASNTTSPGADAPAKQGRRGEAGIIESGEGEFIHPAPVAHRLDLLRDAYLANRFDLAIDLAAEYLRMVAEHRLDFVRTDPRLAGLHAELIRLARQLDMGLDYFGNPPGWTPMLSLEVLQRTYADQVDESLRLLALVHWLEASWDDDDQRRHSIAAVVQAKRGEIDQATRLYRQSLALLPRLQRELREISADTDRYLVELEGHEKRLLDRYKSDEERRRLMSAALGAMRSGGELWAFSRMGSPGGMPKKAIAALAGAALVDNLMNNPAGNVSPGTTSDSISALLAEDGIAAAHARFAALGVAGAADPDAYADALNDLSASLGTATRQRLDYQIQTQIGSESQARFEALKDEDPELQASYREMIDLITRKEVFAGKVAETFQLMEESMSWMAEAGSAIDRLRDEAAASAPDADVRAALRAMDRRARERLVRYKYFLAKAYEYRMLQPCPIDYRDNRLFDELAAYSDRTRQKATLPRTGPDQLFEALRSIYREDIGQLQELMLREYSESRPESIRVSRRVVLGAPELEQLNRDGWVQIDLGPRVTLPTDRNARIASLSVDERYTRIRADEDSPQALTANLEIGFAPGDWTLLRWQDKELLFRYGATRDVSLVRWGFSWYPGGEITPFGRDEEELDAIKNIADIRRLRLRPGAHTLLNIRRELTPPDAPIEVERLAFIVAVDKHKVR